jgi:hypothetical protein
MPIFEETSGTSPDDPYNLNSWRASSWGRSWRMAWRFAWGYVRDTPFLDTDGTQPEDVFETGSGAGPTLYSSTSGTSPDNPYEEN